MLGIYVRVSTLGQADNFSVPTQIQEGMNFAVSNGWDFKIYQEAESGKSIEPRTEFQRMITDIENGTINKIWVIHQDRLNRNSTDASLVKEVCRKYKTELYVRGDPQKFETASDRLAYGTKAVVAEYVRENIIETSIRGKNEWQNTGHMAVPHIFGYSYDYQPDGSKKWKKVDREVEAIQLIYKMYVEDQKPYNQIRRWLNDHGYRSKSGGFFYNSQLKAILSQSLYTGTAWTTTGEEIESKVYESIISKELFKKAQRIRAQTSNQRNRHGSRKAAHELSSMIKCGRCGATYFYQVSKKKYASGLVAAWERYYHDVATSGHKACCQNVKGLQKQATELMIANLITDEFYENEDKFISWWKHFQKKTGLKIDQLKATIDVWEGKKKEIEAKRNRIVKAIADGTLQNEDARDTMAEFNRQVKDADVQIIKLRNELEMETTSIDDEVYRAISDLTHKFSDLTIQQRRSLYKLVIKGMVLVDNKLTVTLYDGRILKRLVPLSKGHPRKKVEEENGAEGNRRLH